MTAIPKNRHMNLRVFNHIKENGSQTRADLRRAFMVHGDNKIRLSINELIHFNHITERDGRLEVVNGN